MTKPPVRVFVAYARADKHHLRSFRKYCADLASDDVEFFDDRDIPTGADWERILLEEYLGKADIVALLVTPSFLHSTYCMEVELPRAMKRRDAGECELFLVKVEPCFIRKRSPLRALQWTPSGGTVMGDSRFHEASKWEDVAKALSRSVDSVRGSRETRQEEDVHPYSENNGRRGLPWWVVPLSAMVVVLALVITSRATGSSPTSMPEVGNIVNKATGESQCISYFDGSNRVLMSGCGTDKSNWVMRSLDDGYVKFESVVTPKICLGVNDSANVVGSWLCRHEANVAWRMVRDSDGYVQLRSRYVEGEGSENACLTNLPDARDEGTLHPEKCDDGDVQKWKILKP